MEQASGSFSLFLEQQSFDLFADIRAKNSCLPIMVIFFLVEDYQLKRHGQQLYLGKVNDKNDLTANNYWRIKEGSRDTLNQLFHHSPLTISLQGEVSAYLDTWEVYDYTYVKSESILY